jgi:hypothetical protein
MYTWFIVVFSVYLRFYDMASSRVCDVDDIVSILDDDNGNLSYDSSSGSDYEIFHANMSKSESGTSDNGSETLVTRANSNWLQVTDCDCEYIKQAVTDSQQGGGPPAWGFDKGLTTPHSRNQACQEIITIHLFHLDI